MQPAVQLVDLSNLRRRQEGGVVGQADDWVGDRQEGHCPAVGQWACNRTQEEPWEAGRKVCQCTGSKTRYGVEGTTSKTGSGVVGGWGGEDSIL